MVSLTVESVPVTNVVLLVMHLNVMLKMVPVNAKPMFLVRTALVVLKEVSFWQKITQKDAFLVTVLV